MAHIKNTIIGIGIGLYFILFGLYALVIWAVFKLCC